MSIDEKAFKAVWESYISEIRDVRGFVERYEAAKVAGQLDDWRRVFDLFLVEELGLDALTKTPVSFYGVAQKAFKSAWHHKRESGWQPIETAPQNGTHILVCQYHKDGFTHTPPTVAHYFWGGFYSSVSEVEPEKPFELTHWMPLPHPPTDIEGERK